MTKRSDFCLAFEGKAVDANFVITLLQENNIPAFSKDDMMSQVFPLFVFSGELHPVKVYVEKNDKIRALEIIKAYLDDNT